MARSNSGSLALSPGTLPETVYYHAGDAWITDTQLVLADRAYPLRGIKSLDVVPVPPSRRLLYVVASIPAVVLILFALVRVDYSNPRLGDFFRGIDILLVITLLGVGAFALFRRLQTRLATLYLIRLDGKRNIYTTTDGDYARWLVGKAIQVKEGAGSDEAYFSPAPEIGTDEHVHYSDGVTAVTSKRVILGRESYELEGIKKARAGRVWVEPYVWRWNLGMTLLGVNSWLAILRRDDPNDWRDFYLLFPADVTYLPLLVILTAGAFIFWAWATPNPTAYPLRLQGESGEARWIEAFASFNQAYTKTLTDYINNAVSARRAGIHAGNAAVP